MFRLRPVPRAPWDGTRRPLPVGAGRQSRRHEVRSRTRFWYRAAVAPIVAGLLLSLLPGFAGATGVNGIATSCTNFGACSFALSDSNGTGWATTSGSTISFQVPGEALATSGVPYTAQVVSVNGSLYTVNGSFAGADANTGKAAYGSTQVLLTVTVFCQRGCTTTYKLDNGTITIVPTTADVTNTSVSCLPTTFTSGNSTVCTATVVDLTNGVSTPTGVVNFTSSYSFTGAFSNGGSCTLVAGQCSVTFNPGEEAVGTFPVYAAYAGNPTYFRSAAKTLVYVNPDLATGGGGGSGSYTVSFVETGLPSGSLWSVGLGAANQTSSGSSANFTVANGSYGFVVHAPGEAASPASGTANVSGANVIVSVSFSPLPPVRVTFGETGLPLGALWTVSVGTSPPSSRSTNTTGLFFDATNGTTSFSITPPAGYGVAKVVGPGLVNQSAVNVLGNTTLRVFFGPLETVFFNESSMPGFEAYPGATWSVALVPALPHNGPLPLAATTNTTGLAFSVPAGAVFRFSVTGPGAEYKASPSHGAFQVPTHDLGKLVKFHLLTSVVSFQESGLPTGTTWTVTITNGSSPALAFPFTISGTGTSLKVRLPAGTYGFSIAPEGALTPSPASGTLTIVVPASATIVPVLFA